MEGRERGREDIPEWNECERDLFQMRFYLVATLLFHSVVIYLTFNQTFIIL